MYRDIRAFLSAEAYPEVLCHSLKHPNNSFRGHLVASTAPKTPTGDIECEIAKSGGVLPIDKSTPRVKGILKGVSQTCVEADKPGHLPQADRGQFSFVSMGPKGKLKDEYGLHVQLNPAGSWGQPWGLPRLIKQMAADILCTNTDLIEIKTETSTRDSRYERRVISSLPVSSTTAEVFWNGGYGYRAHYYLSQHLGPLCDAAIILGLLRELGNKAPGLSAGLDHKSFLHPTAKVYCNKQMTNVSKLGELHNPMWDAVFKATNEYAMDGFGEILSGAYHGRYAYTGTSLTIKGGFLNKQNPDDFLNTKPARAEELHYGGWT